jgi:hypothetical protein
MSLGACASCRGLFHEVQAGIGRRGGGTQGHASPGRGPGGMGGHGAIFHAPHGSTPMGIAHQFGGNAHQLVHHNSHKRRIFRNGAFTFVDLYDDEPLWIPWAWINPTCSYWTPIDPSQVPPVVAHDAQYAQSQGYTTPFFVTHSGVLYAITGGSIQVCS